MVVQKQASISYYVGFMYHESHCDVVLLNLISYTSLSRHQIPTLDRYVESWVS